MFKQIAACAVLASIPFGALAQSAERDLTIEVDATVTAVNQETRTVVLDNHSTGQSEVIVAGPEVINFDQIEKGDTVKAIYTLGIAARMADPGEVDSVTELDVAAAKGEKPGALSGTAVTLILEFVSYDPASSVATVKTSEGVEEKIEVASDEGKAFASDLLEGDKVALTFTEGVAIGIVEN